MSHHADSNKRSFTRDSASTVASRVAVVFLTALTHVALARLLGATGRGAFAALIVVPTLYASVVQQGGQRSIARAVAGGLSDRSAVFNASAVILLVATGVGTIVSTGAALLGGMDRDYGLPNVVLATGIIPAMLSLTLGQGFLLGDNDFKNLNKATVYSKVGILAATVLLVLGGWGVGGALTGFIVGWAGAGAIVIVVVARRSRRYKRGGRALERTSTTLRSILSAGLLFTMAQLFMQVNLRADVWLLNLLAAPRDVGHYAVASNVAEMLLVVPAAVGAVLFGRSAADARESGRLQQVARAIRVATLLAGCSAILIMVTAWPVVPFVFGEQYDASVPLIMVLVPGVVALGLFKVLYGEVAGKGVPPGVLVALGAGSAANVLLNLVLIPRLGPVGAAYASSVCYAGVAIFLYVRCLRRWRMSVRDVSVPRREDVRVILGKFRAAFGSNG